VTSSARPDLTVSIALATYDGARFLPAQLESYLDQTHPPDELVIGDDGSTDATLELLEAFARRAPFPVNITRNPERLGFSRNFLSIAARTTGDLVAFSDQDDVWHPTKLRRCVQVVSDHPTVTLVNHRARIIDHDGRPTGGSFPDRGRTRLVRRLGLDPWTPAYGLTIVVRRKIVDLATRLERPLSFDLDGSAMDHDEWVAFLARSLFDVAILDEDLVDYRRHATNVIGPPVGGRVARIQTRVRLGATDYRRHEALYRDFRRFWTAVAADPGVDTDACRAAADRYGMLQTAAALAADARRDDRSRLGQLQSLGRLAIGGTYRRRASGGLGPIALARDVMAAALGVRGDDQPSGAGIPDQVLDRIVAERGEGRSFDEIADRLDREGVAPPTTGPWRGSTVHRLAYLRRSSQDVTRGPAGDDRE
jgi:glycosyltransferase involved in cell wall biosynthesis